MRTKGWMRRIMLSICLIMAIGMAPGMQALAAECFAIKGDNVNDQSYLRGSDTVNSYLSYDGKQTLMKVQAANGFEGVLVEYYNMNYQLQSYKVIPQELPMFGGFYETADNYYLVTGQANMSESADVEVFRITKYDKSWNRITSTGLYDCNTTVPFDAGTLRMAGCGKYLLIRTCHEMYTSEDGRNHQANVMIQLDTEAMKITDSHTSVSNIASGYVSHSFNQFIGIEDNKIVAVDHGDAYPRSIVLVKYGKDVTDGTFRSNCKGIDVMQFPGTIGQNVTGASIGGFEIADNHYLIAGNSVVQDEQNTSRKTRNIFVAAVSKTTDEVTTRWFTSYKEGETSADTPQLIALSDSEYLLLWARETEVYYMKLNAAGEQIGSIYSMEGALSDCKPVIAAGKVIWYTWNNEKITFYDINISDLSKASVKEVITGHQYENKGVNGGYADMVCSVCGSKTQMRVPDSVSVWWNEDGGYSYSSYVDLRVNVNDSLNYMCLVSPSGVESDMVVESSDTSVIQVEEKNATSGKLIMKKSGTATVTIKSKYNPDAKRTYTFIVYAEGVKPVTYVSFDNDYVSLKVGESKELGVHVYPDDASDKSLLYTSSDTSIATVDNKGKVTAKGVGTAIITATAQDGSGKQTTCSVVVTKAEGSSNSGNGSGGNTGSGNGNSGNTGSGNTNSGNGNSGNTNNGNGTPPKNGWYEVNGAKYWYENGVRQGYDSGNAAYRGKEIYDPKSDAWYWLDNVQDGAMATDKDVYQESLAGDWGDYIGEDGQRYGKWVRYDKKGHMVKGWQDTEAGTYFFDYIYGTMAKGYATVDGVEYYFNPATGVLEYVMDEVPQNGWKTIDGKEYWYENYVRQGYSIDASYRGKEIFDPDSDAWYWLDNVQGGAKAVGKDVYQESSGGKWVRYDEYGAMIKGWQQTEAGTYYFDLITGAMIKGNATIDGEDYYFDTTTGILQ